jgi:benzoyl-CoA reductase subunit C
MNRSRAVTREVLALRHATPPRISGTDALAVVLCMQVTDKREHAASLADVLPKLLQSQSAASPDSVRVILVGSEEDDLELVRLFEEVGANIAQDDHCTGTRYVGSDVDTTIRDPLAAIASRYCDRAPCPSKDWEERERVSYVLNLANESQCRGAILTQQKFCDPHELDIPALKAALEAAGLPVLLLELDSTIAVGQYRTRVEAFIEMLRVGDLF